MIVDYLIVGTGISGLNMGLKLSKKYIKNTSTDSSTTLEEEYKQCTIKNIVLSQVQQDLTAITQIY